MNNKISHYRPLTIWYNRHSNMNEDKRITQRTISYTLDYDNVILSEYEKETCLQFGAHKPYIGCAQNHLSVIADNTSDLAFYESYSSSTSLYS